MGSTPATFTILLLFNILRNIWQPRVSFDIPRRCRGVAPPTLGISLADVVGNGVFGPCYFIRSKLPSPLF